MKELYVVNCCRTAVGSFGGSLKNTPAAELGSIVVKEALKRANVAPENVDEVMFGCILTAGLGQNVARQVCVGAGLPYSVPAYTVGMVCGSGMKSVIEAGDVYKRQRQDRKAKSRDPISAKLVANMLVAAGVDRVLTMDLHANQIQGFFDIPVDNLFGNPIFVDYYAKKFGSACEDMVVVSPDVGSVARARTFAQKLHMNLAIVDKRRQKGNQCEVMNVIGDVEGKECILFDDMVDTAGSLCNAAKAIVEVGGAKKVYACASHGVLSGPALERLAASSIEELALLDTIPAPAGEEELAKSRIKYLTVAPMFAEAIERTYQEISIAKLFN